MKEVVVETGNFYQGRGDCLDFQHVKIDTNSRGNCVAQAIWIATGLNYQAVRELILKHASKERTGKRKRGKSHPDRGVYKLAIHRVMKELGWTWTPTMQIGSGCKVHLRKTELPLGTLVVSCSKHVTCVMDHVIHDSYNPDRGGTRCVYGYWSKV